MEMVKKDSNIGNFVQTLTKEDREIEMEKQLKKLKEEVKEELQSVEEKRVIEDPVITPDSQIKLDAFMVRKSFQSL
jgi:hypothetical protein